MKNEKSRKKKTQASERRQMLVEFWPTGG